MDQEMTAGQGSSRRGVLAKIGAVAAGAAVAPAVLSSPVGAAPAKGSKKDGPVLLSAFATDVQRISIWGAIYSDTPILQNIVPGPNGSFVVPNTGVYRVTFGGCASGSNPTMAMVLMINQAIAPGTELRVDSGYSWSETTVLVQANAGDSLSLGAASYDVTLDAGPFGGRSVSLTIEQVA